MKRPALFLALLCAAALLWSCGTPKNTISPLDPLATADAAQRMPITISVYDGETVRSMKPFALLNNGGSALIEQLRAVPAQLETEIVPAITFPIYGITGEKPDGTVFRLAFIDDYCITEDGLFYRFWFDFEEALTRRSWDWSSGSIVEFPCAPILFVENNGITEPSWRADLMLPAPAQEISPPSGITAEFVQWDGGSLTIAFRNDSGATWSYGSEYRVEVCMDGIWYTLPYHMNDFPIGWWLVSYSLGDGKTAEQSYNVSSLYGVPARYNHLPAGLYRIITNGLAVEFEVN